MRAGKKIGGGCECAVYAHPKHPDRVVKTYTTYGEAVDARKFQALAHEHGLAPPVYDDVIETTRPAGRYAYISGYAPDDPPIPVSETERLQKELTRLLRVKVWDVRGRSDNCGWWDGKAVVVDFGHYTTEG